MSTDFVIYFLIKRIHQCRHEESGHEDSEELEESEFEWPDNLLREKKKLRTISLSAELHFLKKTNLKFVVVKNIYYMQK